MLSSLLYRWIQKVSGAVSRDRRTRRPGWPRFRPRLDALEDRWLPSTVVWGGAAGDGLWRTAANWVGGVVPGPADDALIDNTSPAVTVTLTGGAPVSVQSLTSTKDLVVQGSLTVTVGPSSVSGAFTLAHLATLGTDGQTASWIATGPTTLNGANLLAQRGGKMNFPQATSYGDMTAGFGGPLVHADGTNSLIDLSNVTIWQGPTATGQNHTNVQATNSGAIDLSQVPAIATGSLSFLALDSGQIDLTALTDFTGEVAGGSSLSAGRGGMIVAPALASLTDVNLSLGGRASLPVAGLTSIRHGFVSVSRDGPDAGVLALPLTTIDESDLTAFSVTWGVSGL